MGPKGPVKNEPRTGKHREFKMEKNKPSSRKDGVLGGKKKMREREKQARYYHRGGGGGR